MNSYSSQFLAQWPTPELRFDEREFREQACTYLGLPSPEACRLIAAGRTAIATGGSAGAQRVLDASASEAERAPLIVDAWRIQHNSIARIVSGDALAAGFEGTVEPRRIFTSVIPPEHLLGRGVSAIIPDLRLRIQFPDLAEQPARWRDVPRDHLFDFKCAHLGCAAYRSGVALRERAGAVASYARAVHTDVRRHARSIDARLHGAPAGSDDGPVSSMLRSFPPVHGLVFGARAEASPEVDQLARIVAARQAATSWRSSGARSRTEAYAFLISRLRRRWGCVAAREHARMRLARLALVGSRGRLSRPQHEVTLPEVRATVSAAFQEGLHPLI